jgi:hypothetical protein
MTITTINDVSFTEYERSTVLAQSTTCMMIGTVDDFRVFSPLLYCTCTLQYNINARHRQLLSRSTHYFINCPQIEIEIVRRVKIQ